MSQLWGLLHKDQKQQQEEQHTDHSVSSQSTLGKEIATSTGKYKTDDKAEDGHKSIRDGDAQIEEGSPSFNDQLRRKLSNLTMNKKKRLNQQNKKGHHSTSMVEDNYFHKNSGNSSLQDGEGYTAEIDDLNSDEGDDGLKEIDPINIKFVNSQSNHDYNTCSSNIGTNLASPGSLSSTSSSANIFERSVQDQATMSSISRRNSHNPLISPSIQPLLSSGILPSSHALGARSPSFSLASPRSGKLHGNNGSIPDHLNSEVFIPTVLDATTAILSDDNTNLEDVEVIQSTNMKVNDMLDRNYSMNKDGQPSRSRRTSSFMSKSTPISRRNTNTNLLTPSLNRTQTSTSFLSRSDDVDYSDSNKLNFCSFADLLSDELIAQPQLSPPTSNTSQQQLYYNNELNTPFNIDDVTSGTTPNTNYGSPILRRNTSSMLIVPALSLSKTSTSLQREPTH